MKANHSEEVLLENAKKIIEFSKKSGYKKPQKTSFYIWWCGYLWGQDLPNISKHEVSSLTVAEMHGGVWQKAKEQCFPDWKWDSIFKKQKEDIRYLVETKRKQTEYYTQLVEVEASSEQQARLKALEGEIIKEISNYDEQYTDVSTVISDGYESWGVSKND